MFALVTAASAVVPSLMLIWFFHSRDAHPEPQRVIWATFGLGVLTVIPVLVVAAPVAKLLGNPADPYVRGLSQAFLTAAIPEEFFKWVVVVGYCAEHPEFDEPMDGIVYGAVASLGFATLENVLYVADGGLGLAALRALTAVPGHAFMGAIMGYFVGQARFNPTKRAGLLAAGYGVAVLLHGMYDFPVLTLNAMHSARGIPDRYAGAAGVLALGTLAVLVVEGTWAVRLARRLAREQRAALSGGPRSGTWPLPRWLQNPPAGAGAVYPAGAGPVVPAGAWGGPATEQGRAAALWVMVVVGGLMASAGGLFALSALLVAFKPGATGVSPASAVGVGVIFGLVPLTGGIALFATGLRRLNAVAPTPRVAYARASATSPPAPYGAQPPAAASPAPTPAASPPGARW